MGIVLDLGAGAVSRVPGAIKADLSISVVPDIVLNAESGLPFRDSSLQKVVCFDVLEHVANLSSVMSEIHRVLEPTGTLLLTTPHFSCANSYTDPTHKHHFSLKSFDYFTEGHDLSYYSRARFTVRRKILRFHSWNL